MIRCASCQGALTGSDRFCPACGTPNRRARLHPKFGVAPTEPPGPPERPAAPPVGVPSCPRCWAEVALADPYCAACGLSLDGLREAAARAEFLGAWTVPGPGVVHPYHPERTSALVVRGLLVLLAASAVVVALAATARLSGTGPGLVAIGPDLDLATWAARAQLAVLATAGLLVPAFLWWFSRSYRNLPVLGVRGLRFAPAWATGSWFLPLVNLVVPKELTDDLYRASDPDVPLLSSAWRQHTVPLHVHAWWVGLLSSLGMLVITQWALGAGAGTAVGQAVAGVTHLLVAATSLLGMVLVGEVASRQRDRAEGLGPIHRPGHPVPEPSPRYRTGLEQHAPAFPTTDRQEEVVPRAS
jgi:hypothetical protein